MNFDIGNVLSRTWQITWRYKSLWLLVVLPILFSILIFPILILPIYLAGLRNISDTTWLVFGIAMILYLLLFNAVFFAFASMSSSSFALGVLRAERGEGSLKFKDLLMDGLEYFWRMLGAMLMINLSIGMIFTVFFMLVFILTLVTMGMAAICLQPIMILLTPFMFLMLGLIEAANMAIVAEGLKAVDAIKRGWRVVRTHVWQYVLVTLIVYFGTTILTSFIVTPLMVPIFFVPLFMDGGSTVNSDLLIAIMLAFGGLFFIVMMLVSSVTGTFMKVSLDLTYLRLTAVQENHLSTLEKQSSLKTDTA